jgi:hypothetical protein
MCDGSSEDDRLSKEWLAMIDDNLCTLNDRVQPSTSNEGNDVLACKSGPERSNFLRGTRFAFNRETYSRRLEIGG